MNKILTLFWVILASLSLGMAQSMEFINPPTSAIARSSSDDTTKTYFHIKNTSDSIIMVKARRLATNMATGMDTMHQSFFCWDVCYGTSAAASAFSISIEPGDTTSVQQYLVLVPNEIPGYSTVTMRFFVENNPSDFVDHTYEFSVDGATDLEDELDLTRVLSAPYPNPAKDQAFVDYELPNGIVRAEIAIYNLIGKRVRAIPLERMQGKVRIATADLTSGVYFLYLSANNEQITSRKLIIAK